MPKRSLRTERIVSYLKKNNLVTVNDLIEETGVSAATIRRELIELDKKGVIIRSHGGVTLKRFIPEQPTTLEKNTQNLKEKERIAHQALELICPGNAIILDAGTTCLELAKRITHIPLRVITADLHIALHLCEFKQIEVTMIGGRVDDSSQSCIGDHGKNLLDKIFPDIAFVSCNCWDMVKGVTTPTEEKASLKYAQVKNATRKILLADSSKYEKYSLFRICSLEVFDMIITDHALPKKIQDALIKRYPATKLIMV